MNELSARSISFIERALEPPPSSSGIAVVETPIGLVGVSGNTDSVHRVILGTPPAVLVLLQAQLAPPAPFVVRAASEIGDYLAGRRRDFSVSVDLSGTGDFQRAVLEEVRRLPRGTVATYAEIAGRIGHPRAHRAVGTALGHNPVPLIIPCHRVLRSGGQLGQYSGGGPETKRWLLELEGAVA